jgi:hypothetical protein
LLLWLVGDLKATAAIDRALEATAELPRRRRSSADLLSRTSHEVRVIEVKGRGSSGPIEIIDRELDTLRDAGRLGWLYGS